MRLPSRLESTPALKGLMQRSAPLAACQGTAHRFHDAAAVLMVTLTPLNSIEAQGNFEALRFARRQVHRHAPVSPLFNTNQHCSPIANPLSNTTASMEVCERTSVKQGGNAACKISLPCCCHPTVNKGTIEPVGNSPTSIKGLTEELCDAYLPKRHRGKTTHPIGYPFV